MSYRPFELDDIGQFFIIGVSGKTLNDEEREYIEKYNVGGVIFFAHNYESPAQIAEFSNQLQTCRKDFPLFISVDQEGGRVMRFKSGVTQFPPMNIFSKLDSPKMCFEAHQLMGKELSACGVNLNFSPCADIWTNSQNKVIGDRAFGSDVETVDKNISAAIRGLKTEKIMTVAKHFPGHGDTLKDSHYDLPLIKKSLKDLEELEIKPFYRAAKSKVDMIMMAHLQVDAIDEDYPTSLSKKAYDYLRSVLRFDRLIITDDMVMKAITDRMPIEEACVQAFEAGANLMIIRDFETSKKCIDHMREKVREKKFSQDFLNLNLQRVYASKEENLSSYKPIYMPDISKAINSEQSTQFLESLTQNLDTSKD